jgi:hypothetical protein
MVEAGTPKAAQPLTAQRKEAYAGLSDFTLALIQAMLRTGYYASDHPEAQKSIAGLYQQFCALMDDRSELTYMIFEQRDTQEIVVEGYTNLHLSLYEVMMRGMADLFTPKFLDFFKRWSLLSFSIKAETSEQDFDRFIELMSQPPAAGTGKSASERLTQAFADNNILHISTVFKHEMVGRERHLPWRVRLALSRLRRDLRVLPLYKQATPEQLSRIKLQIIDDVIRPVRTAALLKDFLVNYDLIAADIAVLDESAVENEICQNLTDSLLVTTASEIVGEIQKLSEYPAETFPWGEKVADVKARHLAAQKVLTLEELPPELRHAVETRHLAEAFINKQDQYLAYLRKPTDGEATKKLAATIYRITPDLLLHGAYDTVDQILQIVDEGRQSPRTGRFFDQLAGYLLKGMTSGNVISHMLSDLGLTEKEERNRLVPIFAFIGEPALPGLLKVYDNADDKSVRLTIFDTVRAMGSSALAPFLSRLKMVEGDWAIVRHALNEVAESGEASLAKNCAEFLDYPNAHVRHAALSALLKLCGASAEAHFVQALSDAEAEVRQAAVACLAAVGSRDEAALAFYTRVLNPEDLSAEPESDCVLIEVSRALAGLAGQAEDAVMAQEVLLAAIRPVKAKGVLGKLKKPAPRYGEHVEQAALQALAAVGTLDAVQRIEELAAADAALAAAAAKTIEQIKQRNAGTGAAT